MSIQSTVDAVKARIKQEADDELRRRRDALNLDTFAVGARAHANAIAARASEIVAVREECSIPSADRTAILEARPGLAPWLDALDQKDRDLYGLTFDTQSRLQRALERFERLTLDDWRIPEGQFPEQTALGEFPPALWRLRETLGNLRPLCDIDEAIVKLRTAFAELSERLASLA